jgi:hypothetical protein
VLVTAIDLEWEFSIAGDMVTKKQGSLLLETICVTQELKDWNKSSLFDIVKYWGQALVCK